ncbi:MAG TPA: DUF3108 domain-containing protein [Pyrinomonadaceae bacterium]|nr:DUF3108 domain-containing protein [Pyrinomonadaceae bacterium]
MKLRSISSALVLLLSSAFLIAVRAQQPAVRPFGPGEQLIYKAEVSRSLLKKIDVATFKFQVEAAPMKHHGRDARATLDGTLEGTPALRFIGDVASEGFFTKLFNLKFHQHVESTVDPESLAVRKTVKLDEQGKRVRASEAVFDSKTNKVTWVERDPNDPTRPERILSSDFTGTVQDVVSAIYYLRTQKLEPGTSFEMELSDSGRVYKVPVRVLEKKRMKTVLGKHEAVNVVPQLFGEGGLLNRSGQLSIWLTDDSRHIPVKAQLKGDFGTFDITLKQVSGVPPARK